jgi:hypothetical protein
VEVISVQLQGERLIDMFAYRGFLYGWNFENQLLVYSVDSIIGELGASYGPRGLAAAYGLFCSRGIGATDEMKTAFNNRSADTAEALEVSTLPLVRAENVASFKHVIDMKITYDRLYLATEMGLFILSLLPARLIEEQVFSPHLEREGECIAVSTGLRAVGASFGTEGLYVVSNDVSELMGPRTSRFLPVTSVRSSLGASKLVNFPSQEETQIIPISVAHDKSARAVALSEVLIGDVESASLRTIGSNGYVFWDPRYRRMFDVAQRLADSTGRWFTEKDEQELPNESDPIKVISAAFTGNYSLILETTDGIVAVRDGEDHLVQTGSMFSVRAYRDSWRYRRLVTATSESGTWLHATLNGRTDD